MDINDWVELRVKRLPQAGPSQKQKWREQAIAHLKNGEPTQGNQVPNHAIDSLLLRPFDLAFGRVVLKTKWSKLQSWPKDYSRDNRYEVISLDSVLGNYDPARALDWFDQIPRGGDSDPQSDELTLALKIIGESKLY